VTVDPAELPASLDHAGGAPAQRHLSVAPALDVAGVFAAEGDHRLDRIRRAQRPGEGERHTEAQRPERLVEAPWHRLAAAPGWGLLKFKRAVVISLSWACR
jgi:hypothetical protein